METRKSSSSISHGKLVPGRSFDDLPPRVIIFDILTYFVIGDPIDKFELYGYFLKDGMRNIWFVFRSIRFAHLTYPTKFYSFCNWKKVIFLTLNLSSNGEIMKNILCKHSSKFVSLSFLTITCNVLFGEFDCEPSLLNGLFLSDDDFPKLKTFHFSSFPPPKAWEKLKIWRRIENLRIVQHQITCVKKFLVNIYKNDPTSTTLKNLKRLSISDSLSLDESLSSFETLNLPMVEVLEVRNCRRLRFTVGKKKLRKLVLDDVDNELAISLFTSHHQTLKVLKITHLKDLYLGSLFKKDRNYPELRDLEINNVNEPPNSQISEEEMSTNSHLSRKLVFNMGERIEKLCLWNMFIKEENLEHHEYKHLKRFRYKYCEPISGLVRWSFCEHLRFLQVHFSYSKRCQQDNLFKTNNFPNLEVLCIEESYRLYYNDEDGGCIKQVKGFGWNQFPKLRVLELSHLKNLSDLFFSEQNLQELEELSIRGCQQLEGFDWMNKRRFEKLRMFRVMRCPKFGDRLFTVQGNDECPFPSLERLDLTQLEAIEGKNWGFFENLKQLTLTECKNLRDGFLTVDRCYDQEKCKAVVQMNDF